VALKAGTSINIFLFRRIRVVPYGQVRDLLAGGLTRGDAPVIELFREVLAAGLAHADEPLVAFLGVVLRAFVQR